VDRSPRVRAEALVRATLSLGDAALRSSYVASVVRSSDARMLAPALDVVCERAEQAESGSREALVAIVDALNAEGMDELVQRLREEAIGASLLALERLIRNPPRAERERRSRPPVRQLSNDGRSPRMTEDDVVRLAAKRPGRGEVLAEIARSAWVHRPRIRVALVLNPASPLEIVARILGLLLRSELTMVARSPAAPPGVRALSLEHLGRRPPVSVGSQGSA
jgi:hypothetical protein